MTANMSGGQWLFELGTLVPDAMRHNVLLRRAGTLANAGAW